MDELAISDPREAEHETEQTPALVESTGADAADLLRDAKDGGRHAVAEPCSPNLILQRDRAIVVVRGGQRAEQNAVAPNVLFA